MKRFGWAALTAAIVLGDSSAGCSNIAPPEKDAETAVPRCADDLEFFDEHVWGPILSVQCIGCHSGSGPAAYTGLVLETPDRPDYLQHNLATVSRVAARTTGGTSVLLLRPSGKHPEGHRGGALIAPESPGYGDLQAFVARVTKGDCQSGAMGEVACKGPAPGRRVLRRLTRDEYDHTITDLFGLPSTWGRAFVVDVVKNGFDNDAASLVVSPLLADQLRKAAEDVADQALTKMSTLVTCTPDPPGVDACARTFVTSFGKRAFRRPLTAAETERYVALQTSVTAEDGFAEGVRYVLTAMLQSSSFLYRLELGDLGADDAYHLGPYEVASELSYLIWGTMPDEELFRAADSGALARPEDVERQARRLLADPRSTKTFGRFAEAWLGLGVLPNVVKDTTMFPDFTDAIRVAMLEEATGFVDHVRRAGTGALPELFTATYGVPSPALATFYGASSSGGVAAFTDQSHAGLLSLGAVLSTYSYATHTSPIHRGKFVRERLLCQKLSPPPATLMVQPVPFDPTLPTRAQFAAHAANEPCKSCHRLLDEVGFGFEHFDPVGRYRETEDGKPIDARGEIVSSASSDGPFDGVAALGQKLATSKDADRCFVLEWFRFAYGTDESEELTCTVEDLLSRFGSGQKKLDELVVALTKEPHFTSRLVEQLAPPLTTSPPADAGTMTPPVPTTKQDAGPPSPPTDLAITDHVDSTWAMGSCHTVTVTNEGTTPTTWRITLTISGTLSQNWSSVASAQGNQVTFSGADFNATIAPGESANFGYCVSL
jgi:hypothetical protein